MLPKWQKKYSSNIVGIHFGYKRNKNMKIRRYAIVFHVQQKLGIPIKKIPQRLSLTINGEKISLPTDIIETGITKLINVMMGDTAQSVDNLDEFGTAGLFLTINGDIYVCSNMHVLGPQHIVDRTYSCPPEQQFNTDVICSNDMDSTKAFLQKAEFGDTDLALARFQVPEKATNRIRKMGQPSNFLEDSDLRTGMSIQMFGARSQKVIFGDISELGVSKVVRYDNIKTTITDLIATSLQAKHGDSGSVVVNELLEIVGIVVSIDELFTYVIPWSKIKEFISNL
jgi:hypothetical protein